MIHALLPAILPVLAAPDADAIRLVAAPEAGSYTRTYTTSRTLEGGDLSVIMNGGEVPKMFLPELEYTSVQTQSVTLEDVHGASHERAISEAAMGFEMQMTFGEKGGMEPVQIESSASSALEGSRVRFVTEDGETEARWAEDGENPDDKLLEALHADVDGAGLLPEEPVKEGAEWSAEGSALCALLYPSGELGWSWNGGEEDDIPGQDGSSHGGELELRFVELIEEDGRSLARIEIEGNLVETTTRATDLAEVPVTDGTATETTTTDYAIEGELLWDVERHALHSLELTGEGEGTQETVKDAGQEGGDYASTLKHTAKLVLRVE